MRVSLGVLFEIQAESFSLCYGVKAWSFQEYFSLPSSGACLRIKPKQKRADPKEKERSMP